MADLRSILAQAGFSGHSLDMAYAIAMAESGGNANAFNGNASTGDKSYGLFQINMLGAMGPERLRQFGLSSNDDLYDAVRNAKVAYQMSKGGTDWSPWSTFSRGDYRKYLGQSGAQVASTGTAAQPAKKANGLGYDGGDPFAPKTGDPFAIDGGDPFAAKTGDPFAVQKAKAASTTATTGASTAASGLRDKIIALGMQQLGTPYSWGGGGLNGATRGFAQGANTVGFDCSSLMQFIFGKNGYTLPRVSYDQLKSGGRTSLSSLQPGDLVGFGDGHHIALYLGGGRILEAPHTGAVVRVRTLGANEDAWGVHLHLPGD